LWQAQADCCSCRHLRQVCSLLQHSCGPSLQAPLDPLPVLQGTLWTEMAVPAIFTSLTTCLLPEPCAWPTATDCMQDRPMAGHARWWWQARRWLHDQVCFSEAPLGWRWPTSGRTLGHDGHGTADSDVQSRRTRRCATSIPMDRKSCGGKHPRQPASRHRLELRRWSKIAVRQPSSVA